MEKVKIKICKTCKIELPIEEFNNHKNGKDGKQANCRECQKKYYKEYWIKKKIEKMTKEEIVEYEKYKNCKEGYKICIKCKRELPATLEYFYKARNKDLLSNQCNQCKSEYSKKYFKTLKQSDGYLVYVHTNIINTKKYVGLTGTNPEYRWRKNGIAYKKHHEIFYNDIEKYGWDNFEHEIIASGLTKEEAEEIEELIIEKLDTTNLDKGYNISHGKGNKGLIGISSNSKKVYCDGILFNSAGECAKYYKINRDTMKFWLNGANGMPQEFFDKELHYVGEKEKVRLSKNIVKSVYCEEKIFNSIKECSIYYNTNVNTMRNWLCGTCNMPQKFKDMGLRYYIEE